MNKVIISQNQTKKHPIKDAFFDILSLANQLYKSKSSHLNGLKRGKVYFFKNQVLDLLKQKKTQIYPNIFLYNKVIK